MGQKNEEMQKILTEKKYLQIIFTFVSIVIFLIGLIDSVISGSLNKLIWTVIISTVFLVVMRVRLNMEVTKEIDEIQSRDEK